jgi:hypothetical protein
MAIFFKPSAPRRFDDNNVREVVGKNGQEEEVSRNGKKTKEQRCIFRLSWSVMAADEIHLSRNGRLLFDALFHLAENADFTIGMTATVVYTSPTVRSTYTIGQQLY